MNNHSCTNPNCVAREYTTHPSVTIIISYATFSHIKEMSVPATLRSDKTYNFIGNFFNITTSKYHLHDFLNLHALLSYLIQFRIHIYQQKPSKVVFSSASEKAFINLNAFLCTSYFTRIKPYFYIVSRYNWSPKK